MGPSGGGRRIADPRRPLLFWLAVGWAGFAVLPWYGLDEAFTGLVDQIEAAFS